MSASLARIFGDKGSGNRQKVKLTADFLAMAYAWVYVGVTKGEQRTQAFLARNPFGQGLVVEFADGRHLAQSNAMIRHLARGSALLPSDPFDEAKCDAWMFWEQCSHEPYVAAARHQMVYHRKTASQRDARGVERGEKALDLMERLIANARFFVGDRFSVADIALLRYTRLAHEGAFDLSARPGLRAWIARCENEWKLPRTRPASDDKRH